MSVEVTCGLAAHHAVIELVSKSESGTGILNAETRRKNRVMCRKFVSRDRASQKKLAHMSLKLPQYCECFGGHTI